MNYREAGRSPHPGPYQAPNFAWADHTGTSGRASPPASCAPAAALATSLLVRLVVVGPNYARLLILGTRSNTVRSSAFERRPSLADSRRPHWCRVRLSRSTRGIRFPLDLVGTARESGNACHGRTGLRSALHRSPSSHRCGGSAFSSGSVMAVPTCASGHLGIGPPI